MENVTEQQTQVKVKRVPGAKKLSTALMNMGFNMKELRSDQVLDIHDKGMNEYKEMHETVGAYRADPKYVTGTRSIESLFGVEDNVPKHNGEIIPYRNANKRKRAMESAKMTARKMVKENRIQTHDNCQNG